MIALKLKLVFKMHRDGPVRRVGALPKTNIYRTSYRQQQVPRHRFNGVDSAHIVLTELAVRCQAHASTELETRSPGSTAFAQDRHRSAAAFAHLTIKYPHLSTHASLLVPPYHTSCGLESFRRLPEQASLAGQGQQWRQAERAGSLLVVYLVGIQAAPLSL